MAIRRTSLSATAGQRTAKAEFFPAPIGGMNTVDAHGTMDGEYAISAINVFPLANGLAARGGSAPYAYGGQVGNIDTLMAYRDGADDQYFAAAGSSIYAFLGGGDFTEAKGGLAGARFQSVNIGNNGGAFLWACNGVGDHLYFDGTDWNDAALTGVDGLAFQNVCVYQNRIFLAPKGGLDLYYLDLDAVQGAAHKIPLGAYLERGGELLLLGNVTIDGGYGPDDYLIAVTSEGEVVSFKGRDPSSAETWAMVGRFQIARPLGLRSMCKWGGDLIIMTTRGVAGISSMLSNELAGLSQSATEKIQPTWAAMTRAYGGDFGWQICVYHRRGLLIINAPAREGFTQYIFNPETKAWSVFTGWSGVRCLLETGDVVLGGMADVVQQLDTGVYDSFVSPNGDYSEWTSAATNVTATIQHAFTFAGGSGLKKRYTLMRPYISGVAQPGVSVGISVDNNPQASVSQVVLTGEQSDPDIARWRISKWRASKWDHSGAGGVKTRSRWVNVYGVGYSASIAVQITPTSEDVIYAGSDLQFQVGSAL